MCVAAGNSYFNTNPMTNSTDINTIIIQITDLSNLFTCFHNLDLLFNIILQFTSLILGERLS
jgi:hypothetical protein